MVVWKRRDGWTENSVGRLKRCGQVAGMEITAGGAEEVRKDGRSIRKRAVDGGHGN